MIEPPIKTWSFSAIKDFEKCPYKLWLERVERCEKPNYEDNPDHPLVRGVRIHTEAEQFVKGEGPFTPSLKKFPEWFQQMREDYDDGHVYVEEKWGFDHEWAEVEWKERTAGIICDLLHISDEGRFARNIDYKTGKSMNNEIKHQEQLQLYAVGVFMRFPSVEVVSGEMWYLDEGKTLIRKFTRNQVPHYANRWAGRGSKLINATVFPPKPNTSNCRFCDFGPNVGTGACPYAPDPL